MRVPSWRAAIAADPTPQPPSRGIKDDAADRSPLRHCPWLGTAAEQLLTGGARRSTKAA